MKILNFYVIKFLLLVDFRLKIFVPIMVLAFCITILVNLGGGSLEDFQDVTFSDIDKLSMSNVAPKSRRFGVLTL